MRGGILLSIAAIGALTPAPANNGIAFTTDRFYFDLSYGQGSEFYEESYLPGSTIWKLHFRSILRIELPATGASYRGFTLSPDVHRAQLKWNPSRTRVVAAFGEYAVILSPEFQIVDAYRNTNDVRWLNDDELRAIVETGGRVSKYETGEFSINLRTGQFRKLP